MKSDDCHVQQVFKTVVQEREDISVLKENMAVSAFMRIYEIVDFKRLMEVTEGRQNKNFLAGHYEKVKLARESEPVKAGYIEVALKLHRSVLSIPEVHKTLLMLDQQPVKAIDSVHKIREVAIQRDKKVDLQVWAFKMLADDSLKCNSKDPIPIRALKDADNSLVRLYLWKRQLRDHLWRTMDQDMVLWESDLRTDIRRLTSSLDVIRTELGYLDVRL